MVLSYGAGFMIRPILVKQRTKQMLDKKEPTKEQRYICFIWQALTGGHYPPCAADELEAAAGIIRELGEDSNIVVLNNEIRKLIFTGETPQILRESNK